MLYALLVEYLIIGANETHHLVVLQRHDQNKVAEDDGHLKEEEQAVDFDSFKAAVADYGP